MMQQVVQQNQQLIHQNQQLLQQMSSQGSIGQIMGEVNGQKTVLGNNQIVSILQQQQGEIQRLMEVIGDKDKIIEEFLSKK